MPPLQACMMERPPTPPSSAPPSSYRVDGTADILTQLNKMNIQEHRDGEVTGQNGAGHPSEDDVASLTSAVQNISFVSLNIQEEGPASSQDTRSEADDSEVKLTVSLSEALADTDSDSDINEAECTHAEGSECDDSSSDDEDSDDEAEEIKRKNLKSRGPVRNSTRVYSIDRQAGGCVYTYPQVPPHYTSCLPTHTLDTSLALPAQQLWMDYRDPLLQVNEELSNVDSCSNDGPSDDPEITVVMQEVINQLYTLPVDEIDEFFKKFDDSVHGDSSEGKPIDEGVWERDPWSPVSASHKSSSSVHYDTSESSGIESLSGDSTSQPLSPPQVYGTSPPYHLVPIVPKARPARDVINDSISQDEKDEAILKVHSASEEKLMRVHDPDGDTNLTVLVQFWEKHNRPLALLFAMVERMKFIKNGLSKKTVKGKNALCLAATFAHADPVVARYIAEVMVEYGDDINEGDANGNTVIHCLCETGDSHVHVLDELLIVKKFDVNRTNSQGVSPLRAACNKGAVQMTALLLARGAQPDQPRNGASSRGEPLSLLPADKLQEVVRLYKVWARRRLSR